MCGNYRMKTYTLSVSCKFFYLLTASDYVTWSSLRASALIVFLLPAGDLTHKKDWAIAQLSFPLAQRSEHTVVCVINLYLPIFCSVKTHEWPKSSVELLIRLKTQEMATFHLDCLSLTRKLCTRIFRNL